MKKRIIGLDIIRCIAVFFVVSFHYFAYVNYYSMTINTTFMFFITFYRWISYTCVPLFMLLSGYLLNKSSISKSYYISSIRIILAYFICSVVCFLYKHFFMSQNESISTLINNIFNFTQAPYAWYINMYLGLLFLIPFLNTCYNNLKSQNEKKILLITVIIVMTVPFLANQYVQVLPNWWVSVYPIAYYYIGCYINEYKIKPNKIILIFLSILVLLLEVVISIVGYKGQMIISGTGIDSYGSILTVIVSTTIFLLLYDVEIKLNIVEKIVTHISKVSLEVYLLSWIFDMIFYGLLNSIHKTHNIFYYYPIFVVCIFISSVILATIVNYICTFIYKKLYTFFTNLKITKTHYILTIVIFSIIVLRGTIKSVYLFLSK